MRLQGGGKIVAVLEAIGRVLGQHLGEDGRGLDIHAFVQRAHVRDLGLDHFQHQAERALVGEGRLAAEHFEQHDAERENVRALVDRLAQADLGRQVAGRADELAGAGQLLADVGGGECDAEVGDLDLATRA